MSKQTVKSNRKYYTLLIAVIFSLIFLAGGFSALTALFQPEHVHIENSGSVVESADDSPGTWTGALGQNTGEEKEINLTLPADQIKYSGAVRTYYMYAGDVLSDVFITTQGAYVWEQLPSTDIIGFFGQYSNVAMQRFKFYARIGGRTEGVLRYATGTSTSATWATLKLVFVVRNNPYAHSTENSPQNKPLANRTFAMAQSISINVADIMYNPTSMSDSYRIMAAGISYPMTVDATVYATYDIGFDISLMPYTGCYNASGVERITIKQSYNYYASYGVEFIVKNISTGYIGIITCYIEAGGQITQGETKPIEDRTYLMASYEQVQYNIGGGYVSGITYDMHQRNVSDYVTYGEDNARRQIRKNATQPTMGADTYLAKMDNTLDVVNQTNYQAQKQLVTPAYLRCPADLVAAPAGTVYGAAHLPANLGSIYMCSHRYSNMVVYTGTASSPPTLPAITHPNAGSVTCLPNQLTLQYTHPVYGTGYKCPHNYFAPNNSAPIIHPSSGSVSCPLTTTVYGRAPYQTACSFNDFVPDQYSYSMHNWNTVPYYFSSGLFGNYYNYVQSTTTNVTISNTGVNYISLSNMAGATKLALDNVFSDNGSDTYCEIESVYAYDKAYLSVGLLRKRNNSVINIAGLRNTAAANPKYLILAIANHKGGSTFRRLVSVKVTVTNGAPGENPNFIRRVNTEPEAAESIVTASAPNGTRVFKGTRGSIMDFVAQKDNLSSIALDEDNDEFFFANEATLIYMDDFGAVPAASGMFDITRVSNYRISVRANKVFTGTVYLKVEDVNNGQGYIPISVEITNIKPHFSNLPSRITIDPSDMSTGFVNHHTITLSQSAVTDRISSGIASDNDSILGYNDILSIEIINFTVQGQFMSYAYQEPFTDTSTNRTGYKAIKFSAIKWTNGINIMLRLYDGYEYVDTTIIIEIKNTTVIKQSSQSYRFFAKAGESISYTGADLGRDFDGDEITILPETIELISASGFKLATTPTNGFVSAAVNNNVLTITAIAKSKRGTTDADVLGDFTIRFNIKDNGDTRAGSTGLPIVIDVKVDNTDPVATPQNLVLNVNTVYEYSATEFASDIDMKEMSFVVNSQDTLYQKWADKLRFLSVTVVSEPTLPASSQFFDIYFIDAANNQTTTVNNYQKLRIVPKRWTNGTRYFNIVIEDTSEKSITINISLTITNTKPQLNNNIGTSGNPYQINLAMGEPGVPREMYIYPYTLATDKDLAPVFSESASLDDAIYTTNNTLESEYAEKLGKPKSNPASMDYLTFDTADPIILNNAMGYITEPVRVNETCYRIIARIRNTDNPNITMSLYVRDRNGERLMVYLRINVINSSPVLADDIYTATVKVAPESGETYKTDNSAEQTIELSNTHEWRVSDLIVDYDVDFTGENQLDSPVFITTSVVPVISREKYLTNPNDAANSALQYVSASIVMGSKYPGRVVMLITALSQTETATTAKPNDYVWIAFKANDNAAGGAKDSDVLFIKVRVLNSKPAQNSFIHTYNQQPTQGGGTAVNHSFALAARDPGTAGATIGGKTYTTSSATNPLYVFALDPDGDGIRLFNFNDNSLIKFEAANTAFSDAVSATYLKNYDESGILQTTDWIFVFSFTSSGSITISLTVGDTSQNAQIFSFSVTVTTVAINLKQSSANPGVIPVIPNSTPTTVDSTTRVDLFQFIAHSDDGYGDNLDFQPHVRLAYNKVLTEMPYDNNTVSQFNPYINEGNVMRAKNVSATVSAADSKYIQILGGAYFVHTADNTHPESAHLIGQNAGNQDAEHGRFILLRGLQRTIKPVEITFEVNVSNGDGTEQVEVPEGSGNFVTRSKYVDLNGDGKFVEEEDVYKFTMLFTVSNASIIDKGFTDAAKSTSDVRFFYHELGPLSTAIPVATISTKAVNPTNTQIELGLEDDDSLDEFYINEASIDAGCRLVGSTEEGVQNVPIRREYNNHSVEGTDGSFYSYSDFFEVRNPSGTNNPTQYLEIIPKKKTNILPGGYFPLFMMVYDDYNSSSRADKYGNPISSDALLIGNHVGTIIAADGTTTTGAISLADRVYRLIVCVYVTISNSTPTYNVTTPYIEYATYNPNQTVWNGEWYLTQLFSDSDMQLYQDDPRYFDIDPGSTADTISNLTIGYTGDTREYLEIYIGNYKKGMTDYDSSKWYTGDSQKIKYRVLKPIPVSSSSRTKTFTLTFYDSSQSASPSVALQISIYIQNKAPVQTQLNVFEMNVGQSVTFDTSVDAAHTFNQSLTDGSMGVITPAHDDETPELMYITSIRSTELELFQSANSRFFDIERVERVGKTNMSFVLTAINATALNEYYEFRFIINDGDTELSYTEVVYRIKIHSRPPKLKSDGQGVISSRAYELKYSESAEILLTDYISDIDAGDTLTIYANPVYAINGVRQTYFRNDPQIDPDGVEVRPQFVGNTDYLINGNNTTYNNYIRITTAPDRKSFTVTALNTTKADETNPVNTLIFYVVDRANNAVEVVFNFVVISDRMSAKVSTARDKELDGAGAFNAINLGEYIHGEGEASTADRDFVSSNTHYKVSVLETLPSGKREIGRFNAAENYVYNPPTDDSAYFEYFTLPEASGITQGKYVNFISKRRTLSGESYAIDIVITKPTWKINEQGAPYLLPDNESTVTLKFNISVKNSAPTVNTHNLPTVNSGNKSSLALKVGESKDYYLIGSGSQAYLMQDTDLDLVKFDWDTDVTVSGDDAVAAEFKSNLKVDYNYSTGILKITVLKKLKNVDNASVPFVTRILKIQTHDDAGAEGELLEIPISIVNSPPVVMPDRSVINIQVVKDKYYTTVINGEVVSYLDLSSIISDADFNSNIETYSFKGLPGINTDEGMRIYNSQDSTERIATITASADNRRIIIRGESLNRNVSARPVKFTVLDGGGEESSEITFNISVGNTAPEAITSPKPVINILGSAIGSNSTKVYLNLSDYTKEKNKILEDDENARVPEFIQFFRDDNVEDSFMINDLKTDVLVGTQDVPKISITALSGYEKIGFVINTVPDRYGVEKLIITAFDSDPSVPSLGALSATIEITVNIARNPTEVEQSIYTMFNRHKVQISPSDIFGEENSIGYSWQADSFMFIDNGVDLRPDEVVLKPTAKINADNIVEALTDGDARVYAVLVIGVNTFPIIISIHIDKNLMPEQIMYELAIVKGELTTTDRKYGNFGYTPRFYNEIIVDHEGDDLQITEIVSNKPVIVDCRWDNEEKKIDFICKASGRAEISITVIDAVTKYYYKLIYLNTDLEPLDFFAAILAEYQSRPAFYITLLSIVSAVLIVVIIAIAVIIKKAKMRRSLERLLQHEYEQEQELIMISQGFDPNAGYIAEMGELFGIDALNVGGYERKLQELEASVKAKTDAQSLLGSASKSEELPLLQTGESENSESSQDETAKQPKIEVELGGISKADEERLGINSAENVVENMSISTLPANNPEHDELIEATLSAKDTDISDLLKSLETELSADTQTEDDVDAQLRRLLEQDEN